MPVLRHLVISTILTGTVVWAVIGGSARLVAEEPNRLFVDRPSASFAQSNFTKPSSSSSAPVPSKTPEQLHHLRNALSATPPTPPIPRNIEPLPSQPVLTAASNNRAMPPVQQVTAVEPAPLTAEPPMETAENQNTGIATPLETPHSERTIVNSERTDDVLPDKLLDKPIGSAKTENSKGLIDRPKITNAIAPLLSVLGSLLIVIAAFFILVLLLKKVSPKGNRLLPKEAFEDLGRAVLTQKIQLHLLRLGNRLLLVSITPDGVSPITEVTDPDEVVPLLGLCRQLDTHSSTELFRKTLSSFSSGGVEGGYFGSDVKKTTPLKIKPKQSPLVDLYSEPDESLAEILAKGGQHG
jgi:flagellar biogenesis protein FliO